MRSNDPALMEKISRYMACLSLFWYTFDLNCLNLSQAVFYENRTFLKIPRLFHIYDGLPELFPTMKPIGLEKQDSGEAPAEQAPAAEAAPAASIVEEKIDFSNVQIEPLFEDQVDFETFSKSDFRAVKVLACEAVPKSKKLLKFMLDDGSGTERTILSGIHAYYEPEQLIGKTCIAIVNLPQRKMMGIESCGMLISAVHKEGEEEKLHLLMVNPHIPAGAKVY